MRKERINEIWGVFFLLIGLFSLASLLFFDSRDLAFYTSHPFSPPHNYTGIIGAYLSFGLLLTFGTSAFLIPGLFLLWAGCFFLQRVPEKKMFKFLGLGIALFSVATLAAISSGPQTRFERAGAVGYLTGTYLLRYLGMVGSSILAASCLLLSLLLATDFLLYPLVRGFIKKWDALFEGVWNILQAVMEWTGEWQEKRDAASSGREKKEGRPAAKKTVPVPQKVSSLPDVELKVRTYQSDLGREEPEEEKKSGREKEERPAAAAGKPAKPPSAKPEREKIPANVPAASGASEEGPKHEGVIGSKSLGEGEYVFPSVDLLKRPEATAVKSDDLHEKSRILEATLAEFGIEVKVTEVEQGPVITRYELMPAPGVKVNSISALSDDIALAMKAESVRLIIPIPGKSAVGVEIPNSVFSLVYLRELVESKEFKSRKCTLPLALGKNTSGKSLVADLTSMPHILIAGTTGSGKTVCINAVITALLYYCSPADLKFVMIDPKMVELAVYNKIPHMLAPVVTDVKKAAQTLNWVVSEMENRYRLFATCGVRNIQGFNSRPLSEEAVRQTENVDSENVVPPRLPYIVVVIDELADLMLVAQDKVETAITRLAQLSRATGIHLILATQRPSVDVITGVIKANFPARISFKVASKVDSRTVLDGIGADKLLGKGDMLFLEPGEAKPIRGQAALIVDEEINRVVNFVSGQARPDYHPEIMAVQEGRSLGGVLEKDELFDEAVSIVLETGQASTSNLQRRLRLGYTRAARIIDQMEAEGIIGPQQGAKPRDILISREDRVPQENETA